MERVTAAERSVAADPTPEYAALEARVSESLRASAGLVAHEVEDGDGLAALTAARDAHSAALERWAAAVLPTGRRDPRRRRVHRDLSAAPPLARRHADRRRGRRCRA